MRSKLLCVPYLFSVIALFFYSFTQIDLGLPLTGHKLVRSTQIVFQNVGFFHRDASTLIYILIISSLFSSYAVLLYLVYKNKLDRKIVWSVIIFTAFLLAFSYIAFSRDLFNYIFDAKILAHYHQNPYQHNALNYPGDPMLSFLYWIHRNYPYGPVWLGITAPLYALGHDRLIPTFFLFKGLASVFYLGTAYFLEKIAKTIDPKRSTVTLLFFALNPVVIIESLVSSHNDIVMVFFAVFALYLLLSSKAVFAFIIFLLSPLVKPPTAALALPFALLSFARLKDRTLKIEQFLAICIVMLCVALGYYLSGINAPKGEIHEMQPWYLLWFMPFIALLKPNKYVVFLTVLLSTLLLSKYAFFLFHSIYWVEPPYFRLFKTSLNLISPLLLFVMAFISFNYKSIIKKQ